MNTSAYGMTIVDLNDIVFRVATFQSVCVARNVVQRRLFAPLTSLG